MKSGIPKDTVDRDPGFIRLTTDEVRENVEDAIAQVVLDGSRIILHQAGEDVAAIIPMWEFERLHCLLQQLIPSPFNPDEEEYYEDEVIVRCLRPHKIQAEFELILEATNQYGKLFGLIPPKILRSREMDIFSPAAILMPIDKFWIPEHLILDRIDE